MGGGGSPGVGCWPEVASLVAVEGCVAAWWPRSASSWPGLCASPTEASGEGARSGAGYGPRGEANGSGTSWLLQLRGPGLTARNGSADGCHAAEPAAWMCATAE